MLRYSYAHNKNNRSEETEKMMKTYSIDFTKEDFTRRAKTCRSSFEKR